MVILIIKLGETHSRNLSLSVRQNIISTFQVTHIAPCKEYCRQLMSLDNEQFVSGNRDGVGCSTSVLQKISSQARLQLEKDKDLITSLLVLQKMFLNSMPSVNIMRPDSPVRGFIQHIHAYPFGVICFNEVAVRLYHDLAPKVPYSVMQQVLSYRTTKRTRETSNCLLLCFSAKASNFWKITNSCGRTNHF